MWEKRKVIFSFLIYCYGQTDILAVVKAARSVIGCLLVGFSILYFDPGSHAHTVTYICKRI